MKPQLFAPAFLLVALIVVQVFGSPPCRFAPNFSDKLLLEKKEARDEFIMAAMHWEGQFHQNGVGYNLASGLTYDGHVIDYNTGLLYPPLHNFSAASKESLHLGILAHAIQGDQRALTFINAAPPYYSDPKEKSIDILTRKINSLEKFNKEFPGFGGYLPWITVNDAGCTPIAPGWTNHVPGLDNGEMVWSLFAVALALHQKGYTTLASRYDAYLEILRKNVILLFWAGDGNVSAVTQIKNTFIAPTVGNYIFSGGWLDDPYEGELLAFYMDLYASWENPADREMIWIRKRAKLVNVEYQTPNDGPITVQQGYWFSSHEEWKYLELPYVDVPINRRVFLNGERARTWNSAIFKIPGFFASVNNVRQGNGQFQYLSATGIQPIASQKVLGNTTVTPYASYPVILADEGVGLVWYNTMLRGQRMQGIYGSTEATNTSGTAIAPILTWDSKTTTILAMLGGIIDMTRDCLKRDGKYERFFNIIDREWTLKFPSLKGEHLPFATPTAQVPKTFSNFPNCGDTSLRSNRIGKRVNRSRE